MVTNATRPISSVAVPPHPMVATNGGVSPPSADSTTVAGAAVAQPTAAPFRWDRLTWASAFGYCLLVAGLSVGAVLGELRAEFDLSGTVTALHGSTFGIGLLVSGVVGVRVVGRLGRRVALVASAGAILLGIVTFCAGRSWPVTLLGTAFVGFGGAMLVMVMPGLISDHHGERRAEAFAAVNGAPGLAGLLFSLAIGATLGADRSWRPTYLALTIVVGVALAVVARPVEVPDSVSGGGWPLVAMRDRRVLVPWLFLVNAVFAEFAIGIWSATYLKEVGGASAGAAPALAAVFGVMMFATRLVIGPIRRALGEATVPVGFSVVACGAMLMFIGPSLAVRVLGVALVGCGGAPLYPLNVDRLYRAADHLDSVTIGAIAALASGVAVTAGPMMLGFLADRVGLRAALLIVPAISLLGAVTQRPRRDPVAR